MEKILVIGNCGSGKTTIANQLGNKSGLPVFSLDKYYWKPNWQRPTAHEWQRNLSALMDRDRWILDGNYYSTLESRLAACDTVVFIDLPAYRCLFGVLKRLIKNYKREAEHSPAGCAERLDLKFLCYVATYNYKMRPKILDKLRSYESSKQIVCLKNSKDLRQLLESSLASCHASRDT